MKKTRRSFTETQEENFWPSFADIMMLIVMVFLLVMVVLLIKNSDLVSQLKESILAEQRIAESADQIEQQNNELNQELLASEDTLANLQQLLMEKDSELRQLQESNRELVKNQARISAQLEDEQSLKQLAEEELAQTLRTLQTQQEAAELQEKLIADQQGRLINQEADYKELKNKYEKLLKPARSAKGKTVVEVSLNQVAGRDIIRLKEPGKEAIAVDRANMHKILGRYYKKNPKGLYLKIIFPKGSQISQEKAWNFTSTLLNRYDYYYQNE